MSDTGEQAVPEAPSDRSPAGAGPARGVDDAVGAGVDDDDPAAPEGNPSPS